MWRATAIILCIAYTALYAMEENETKESFALQDVPQDWYSASNELATLGNKLKANDALDRFTLLLNYYAKKNIILGNKAHLTMTETETTTKYSCWLCKKPKVTVAPSTKLPAIYIALRAGHIECIRALLHHKISLNIRHNEQTPLQFAQELEQSSKKEKKKIYTQIIALLQQSDAKSEKKSKKLDLLPLKEALCQK